jgi:hypothetical protein
MISLNYITLFNMYGDNIEPDNDINIDEIILSESDKIINKKSNDLYIEKLENLRVIGFAGVGKSTYIKSKYSSHDYLLTAYTRIASSQINGNTISSIFKLGRFNDYSVGASVSKLRFLKTMYLNIQKIIGIVIDEFYITPAAIVDKVDLICQIIRNCKEPFGGLQVILVGDDRQSESIDDSFVDSDLYKNMTFKEIILPEHENMRLTSTYMQFCNQFRNPKLNRRKLIDLLRDKRFSNDEIKDNSFTVYYRNVDCNEKNKLGMIALKSDVIYIRDGISYKKGCPIYITSSSDDSILCNGMMGVLKDKINKKLIIVVDDVIHEVFPSKISFKPGFAITIHLCQSKTWNGVNIYLRKSDIFQNRKLFIRLIYVALTRVRNFEKCYINII